jgi:hyperosmotically inducible protein
MKLTKMLFALTLAAGIGLVSCKPKDSAIQTALEEKIKATTELSGATVTVKDGVATLTGELQDAASLEKATELLKDVKGVKSVVNNLTVAAAPVIEVTADALLSKAVSDAIKDFTTVKADVKDGVVTLTGELAKSSLPKLIMGLNTLKPKKIENKLTIK